MNKLSLGGTGRRKTSVARVILKQGSGSIVVNDKPMAEYFGREILQMLVKQPLQLTKTSNKYDINVNVYGGGAASQAGAIRHGIARSLLKLNPDLHLILKKAGFLTRDPRMKERKKYGQKAARKRFQFSKR